MESQFAEENTIKTCSTSVLSRVVVLMGPQDHFRWYTRSKLFSTQVYVLCLFLCADIAMIVHSNGRKNWGNLGSKQGSGTKPCRSNRILHYQALRAKKKKKKNSWRSSKNYKLYYISTIEPLPFYYSMWQNKKYERYLQERHLCDCCKLNYRLISFKNTFVERTIGKL